MVPVLLLCCFQLPGDQANRARATSLRLSFRKAAHMALSASEELEGAVERLQLLETKRKLTAYSLLPSLRLGYDRNRRVSRYASDSTVHRVSLSLVHSLYDGGTRKTARLLQAVSAEKAEEEYAETREEILNRLWRLYYSRSVLHLRCELQRERRRCAREEEEIAESRFDLGEITGLELLEIRQQRCTAELACLHAEHELENNGAHLRRMLACGRETKLELTDSVSPAYSGTLSVGNEEELLRTALRRNRELRRAAMRVREAKCRYDAARRAAVPSLSLEASLRLEGERVPLHRLSFSMALRISSAGSAIPAEGGISYSSVPPFERSRSISLSGSPFARLSKASQRQRARKAYTGSLQQLRTLREELSSSLSSQLREYRIAGRELELLRRKRELLRDRYEILCRRRDMGSMTGLQIARAREELFAGRNAVLEQRLELLLSERRLERTLGLTPGKLSERDSACTVSAPQVRSRHPGPPSRPSNTRGTQPCKGGSINAPH